MKGHTSDRLQVSVAVFLAALSLVFGGRSAAAQGIVEYSRDPGTVVVSFTEILGEIGEVDRGPSLQIYGDGYALVHYPSYMRRAGDYALQLSQQEVDRLLRSLIGNKVLEFDEEETRRSKRQAAAEAQGDLQSTLFAVTDASTTVIEVRLDRYQPAGEAGQEILNVDKKITWYGLRSDARRYPNIEAIQNLAAAQKELWAVMQRQDLEKIK